MKHGTIFQRKLTVRTSTNLRNVESEPQNVANQNIVEKESNNVVVKMSQEI